MKTILIASAFLALSMIQLQGQNPSVQEKNSIRSGTTYRYSLSTTYLSFVNFGNEKTNTHHYEFHFKYQLTPKDRIGIKVATWQLFAPMGIQLWDPDFLNEKEFFPGRLKECGIGFSYQRTLWKGLFATVEVLPLCKTYLNEDKKNIGNGFKLYTTYHLGYHVSLLKDRFFIEPQIHCNYWPINTKGPDSFDSKEMQWNNYFLFEANLYLGVNF